MRELFCALKNNPQPKEAQLGTHCVRLGCVTGDLPPPTCFYSIHSGQTWLLFVAGLWPLRSDAHRETDNMLVLSFVGQTR